MRVDIFLVALTVLLFVYACMLLYFAAKSQKPLKTLCGGALSGLGALAVVDITTTFTGVFIPLNAWTVGSSAAFGIPGVISLLIINKIIL